jgi:enoyl-CoA hydratase
MTKTTGDAIYPAYASLRLDRPVAGVLRITLARGAVNAMDYEMHHDLAQIWRLVDDDEQTRAVVLTGGDKVFSAGGDFGLVRQVIEDAKVRHAMYKGGNDLVRNMMECSKPVVAAISGAVAGGGLAAAMMADISIAGRNAKIVDAHTRLGVAAGDHAALLWPLLCGMAKAKFYLLTGAALTGEEAERIGLVSLAVPDDQVQAKALEVAAGLAAGPLQALAMTKHALNNWFRMAWPIHSASAALESLGFGGDEAREGLAAHLEKRAPKFSNAT